MIAGQREALDECIAKLRSGRIVRRAFLQRSIELGLSAAAADALLEACTADNSTNTKKTVIIWLSEYDISNAYKQIVDKFNKTNKEIQVIWQNGPVSTDLVGIERSLLRARSTAFDVLSIDITSPAEFAAKGWITPITASQWPASEQKRYLPGPIKGCTVNGRIWAAPFRTDVGLLYYRDDIISTPPRSWKELVSAAEDNRQKSRYGYVWQGAQYEGLVCDFNEVLNGYGGFILDPNDPGKVLVGSAEAVEALTEMVGWVGTISPTAITSYTEELSRTAWETGDAIFMRNWPYAYASGNRSATSKIAGKFAIHPIPYGGHNTVGHSTIGGWQLAINAYVSPEKQHAAWEFIKYMLGPDAQKMGATVATWTVTLQSIYDDPEVLTKLALFKQLKPILQTALPRPVSPKYSDITTAIQLRIHQALTKKMSPREALTALSSDLRPLVQNK